MIAAAMITPMSWRRDSACWMKRSKSGNHFGDRITGYHSATHEYNPSVKPLPNCVPGCCTKSVQVTARERVKKPSSKPEHGSMGKCCGSAVSANVNSSRDKAQPIDLDVSSPMMDRKLGVLCPSSPRSCASLRYRDRRGL